MKRWLTLILTFLLTGSGWAQSSFTFSPATAVATQASPSLTQVSAGFSSVTATQIYSGSTLLPSGTIYWQAVDGSGNPINYQVNGLAQSGLNPSACAISNGAIVPPCYVADTNLTNPLHLCFSVTIRDSSNRLVLGGGPGQGYGCVQPTGSTWSFDTYSPIIAGIPIITIPAATIGGRGMVQAPNCLVLGANFLPQSLNTDGSWNCLYSGDNGDATFLDGNPQTSDSGLMQHKYPHAVTITRISCSAVGGTANINLDIRTEGATDTAGTSVLAAPLTCPSGSTAVATSFAASAIPANSPIALDIPLVSGATFVRVHLETKQ